MRKKRIVRTIHIPLFQKQADIISKIQEEEEITSRIRDLITKYGEEKWPAIPAYAEALKMRAEEKKRQAEEKRKFDSLSPQEYCTGTLGGVWGKEGTCNFITLSGRVQKYEPDEVKALTVEDEYVIMNKEILNGTYIMPSGDPINKGLQDELIETLKQS